MVAYAKTTAVAGAPAAVAHHERAQIPYPDIIGMYPVPDIKISGHIHGRPKCQISLQLPYFFILVATISNFLRCRMLPGTKYMATYGLLCRIQCAAACDWPVGSHMVAYDLFLYGAVASLWGLIWSHTVPSHMAPQPACGGSYGHIRSIPLWRGSRPMGAQVVTYSLFSYSSTAGL